MKKYTLREVCEMTGVSRRAIQGYEKAGLVRSSGKNERGYLLYDEERVERIKTVRLFQQFGFTVKEIAGIIDAQKEELKVALKERLTALEAEGKALGSVIEQLKIMIQSL